jgi:hypothetical protein
MASLIISDRVILRGKAWLLTLAMGSTRVWGKGYDYNNKLCKQNHRENLMNGLRRNGSRTRDFSPYSKNYCAASPVALAATISFKTLDASLM